MDFSTLSSISTLFLEWGLTYVLHSTVFFVIAMVLLQISFFQVVHFKEWILKLALIGGILTATVQTIVSSNTIYLGAKSPPTVTVIAPNEITPIMVSEDIESNVVPSLLIQEELADTSIEASYLAIILEGMSWQMWTLMIWLIIGLSLWLLNWRQHRKFLNYLGQRRQVVDEAILNLVNSILEETNLPASPKVTTAEGLDSPIVIGQEELCLPERVIYDLNFEQQETLIAHEIAHILNQDYYWTRLRGWITAFLFFQPLNRITAALLAATIEKRCDTWSAQITGNYTALALCLIEVASWMQPIQRSTQVTGMALKPSLLKQRIQHLLYQEKNQENMKHSTTKSIFGGFILLAISGLITVMTPNISLAQDAENEPFELSDRELQPSFEMLQTIIQEVQEDSVIVPEASRQAEKIPTEVKEEIKIIDTKLQEIGAEMKALTKEVEIIFEGESKDFQGLEDRLEAMSEALDSKLDKLDPHIDRIEEHLENITELSEEETEFFIDKIEDKIDAFEDVMDIWEDKWEERVEEIEDRVEEEMEAYEDVIEEGMEEYEDIVEDYELFGMQNTTFTSGFENLETVQTNILNQLIKDGIITQQSEFRSIAIDIKKERIIVNQTERKGTVFKPYQELLQQNYKGKTLGHYIWINHK